VRFFGEFFAICEIFFEAHRKGVHRWLAGGAELLW
jgi:hypothetical protein